MWLSLQSLRHYIDNIGGISYDIRHRQLRSHRIIGSLTAACDIGHINDDDALFVVSSACASKIQRRALPQELSNLCLGSTAATQALAATQRRKLRQQLNDMQTLPQQISDTRFCNN